MEGSFFLRLFESWEPWLSYYFSPSVFGFIKEFEPVFSCLEVKKFASPAFASVLLLISRI